MLRLSMQSEQFRSQLKQGYCITPSTVLEAFDGPKRPPTPGT